MLRSRERDLSAKTPRYLIKSAIGRCLIEKSEYLDNEDMKFEVLNNNPAQC